jgi:hypothetical protein
MIRITTSLLMAALGLITSAITLQAANIQITYLPYIISAPGTYLLRSDLSYTSQQGFAINILTNLAGSVVLDFNGHKITGAGAGSQSFGVQVGGGSEYALNTYPITIRNGSLQGFFIGVDAEQGNLAGTTELTVNNMNFSTVSTSFATYGVKLLHTSYSNIVNCVYTGTSYGILDGSTGGNNSYLNNTFNHVSSLIEIDTGSLPTVTVEQCRTTVP